MSGWSSGGCFDVLSAPPRKVDRRTSRNVVKCVAVSGHIVAGRPLGGAEVR